MSLVVGLLLAFFLDSLDHSLRSPIEVEEHLGLPVLAALPESRR
jgi:capsular polysaccharide biosynthesis protein